MARLWLVSTPKTSVRSPALAGLEIPLSQVNAVIAQATASGVNAEVAFTGLKGALARFISGQASKELAKFGINIDAASIQADGLLVTLQKLEGLIQAPCLKRLAQKPPRRYCRLFKTGKI